MRFTMNQTGTVVRGFQTAITSKQSSASSCRFHFRLGRAIATGAMALALLAGAIQSYATNYTWVANSGSFNTAVNWDQNAVPQIGDTAIFTNNNDFQVYVDQATAQMKDAVISNTAGILTIDCSGGNFWVTNDFRCGYISSTTTVYVTGGTLAVDDFDANGQALAQLRIADSTSNIFNCVAAMIVTNGTIAADGVHIGDSSNSVGSLVIGQNATLVYNTAANGCTITVGDGSSFNQLVVTNGGQLLTGDATLTVGTADGNSNNLLFVSDPGTSLTADYLRFAGNAGELIVSNRAHLHTTGSLLFGSAANANTAYVNNATIQVDGSFQIGFSSSGGTNNFFSVSNGSSISVGGTFAYGNNSFHIHDGLAFGGVGGPCTGLFNVVRSASNATNHDSQFLTFSNCFFSCTFLNPQGPIETVSVLGNATFLMTNSLSIAGVQTSSNSVSFGSTNGTMLINGGQFINQLTADNAGGFSVGGVGFNSIIVTNGGKLYTSAAFETALSNAIVVTGSGSVWSNYTTVSSFTDDFQVGSGTGVSNSLGVYNGATLFNGGTFQIGNSVSGRYNQVYFGGPGLPVFITDVGSIGAINVGNGTNNLNTGYAVNNTLAITNANVNCVTLTVGASAATNNSLTVNGGTVTVSSLFQVVATNFATFNGGQINAGGAQVAALANGGNAFAIGNGTASAIYNLSPAGYHTFGAGLSVNNNASLQGSGTISGNVSVSGSFTPGTIGTVGSIYVSNNLTLGATAQVNFDFGSSSDSATVNGNLSLGGVLNVGSITGFGIGTYTVFTYGALTGTGSLGLGTTPGGFNYAIVTNPPAIQLVVSSSAPADPYTTWQSFYFPGGGPNSLGTANPTGDGMSNTNKFLAGFNPTNGPAYLHIISVAKSSGNVVVTYLGASGDNSWSPGFASRTNVLEFTTGTANGWYTNNFASTGQTNILSGGNGFGTVSSMTDVGGATASPTRYYRVRVLLP